MTELSSANRTTVLETVDAWRSARAPLVRVITASGTRSANSEGDSAMAVARTRVARLNEYDPLLNEIAAISDAPRQESLWTSPAATGLLVGAVLLVVLFLGWLLSVPIF